MHAPGKHPVFTLFPVNNLFHRKLIYNLQDSFIIILNISNKYYHSKDNVHSYQLESYQKQ